MSKPRISTNKTAEGAEFLVLGHLLIEDVLAFKCYGNMPKYDIIATNSNQSMQAKISVKSCWRTKADHFLVGSLDCDFVVLVKLNRGSKKGNGEVREPECYVLPKSELKDLKLAGSGGRFRKLRFKDNLQFESYRNKWHLITDFLNKRTTDQ